MRDNSDSTNPSYPIAEAPKKEDSFFQSFLTHPDPSGKPNVIGQKGQGDMTFRMSPVQVKPISTWAKDEAKYSHTPTRPTDGPLWRGDAESTRPYAHRIMCMMTALATIVGACRPVQRGAGEPSFAEVKGTSSGAIDWSKNHTMFQAPDAVLACTPSACPSSAAYELALEKEFWRNVQTDNYLKMHGWLAKTQTYVLQSQDRANRPVQIGRLRKLSAFGSTMIYTLYDLHPMVPSLRKIQPQTSLPQFKGELIKILGSKEANGVLYLLSSISEAMNSLILVPQDRNALTFLLSVGGFAQAAMAPFPGYTGVKAFENSMIGPTCQDLKIKDPVLRETACKPYGLLGTAWDSYKQCTSEKICAPLGTGTEGFTAGAMALTLFHDPKMVQRGLDILGDGPGEDNVALCDSFLCTYNNPNDPQAAVPEATSIAPFKRLGVMLTIAEGYGKLGKIQKMQRVLRAARAEGNRLGWPRMALLDRVETSLTGGDTQSGIPDLLSLWAKPDPAQDFAGEIQFPLPLSARRGACSGCHYGGVMSRSVKY